MVPAHWHLALGEPAKELIERLPGSSEPVIDRHKDAATVALVAVEVVGAVALLALALSVWVRRVPTWEEHR